MIYSLNSIKETILSKDTAVTESYENESLFVYGLRLLEESDMEIRKTLLSIYDNKFVNESLIDNIKKIDLKYLVQKILHFFIKTIKDIFGRLKALLMELFDFDRSIKKYKKELHNMPDSFDLSKYSDIKFHNYSYFEADIPDPNLYLKFSQNYEDSITELTKISKSASKQELINAIYALGDKIDTQSDSNFFNKIRGSIISSGKDLGGIIVTAETYPNYLYSLFRNGEATAYTGKMTIIPNQVAISCDRFLNSKALIRKIEKQQSAIELACSKVEKQFTKLTAKELSLYEGSADVEIEGALDSYTKKKIAQLAEICNICVMAFSAKVEAIKECAVMDKKICYKAITHILTGDLEG